MGQTKERRVLIADDDPDIAEAAGLRLRMAGYQTAMARDGAECLESTRDRPPDAIVLDVRMPQRDGLSVLAELKSDSETNEIPIVMLSASLVDQQRALDAGARFFLTKPYDPQGLVAAVDAAISDPCHLEEKGEPNA